MDLSQSIDDILDEPITCGGVYYLINKDCTFYCTLPFLLVFEFVPLLLFQALLLSLTSNPLFIYPLALHLLPKLIRPRPPSITLRMTTSYPHPYAPLSY